MSIIVPMPRMAADKYIFELDIFFLQDTKEFLGNISTEESHSLQDRSLQDRVEAQVRLYK